MRPRIVALEVSVEMRKPQIDADATFGRIPSELDL